MPEIDSSLYQILTLVLLLVIALSLVGIASALAGMKKSLDAQSARTPERGWGLEPEREADRGEAEQPEPRRSAVQEPGQTFGRREEPARGTSPALGVEPVGGAATQAEPTTATAAGSGAAGAAAEAEPQEQPFERDGRWWFRRGNELLVYDERSGQWVAAPESAPGAGAESATPRQEGAGGAAEGGFWKCPSCGAVNGSTATSCRMCFTARP